MRLKRPFRSTIHAVCCGTNLMTVFAGSDGLWKYVEGGPPMVLEERNMDSVGEGMRCAGVWWKLRCCGVAAIILLFPSSCLDEPPVGALVSDDLQADKAMVVVES